MSTSGNENQKFPSAYEQYNAQQNQQMYGAGGNPYPANTYGGYQYQQGSQPGKALSITSLILGILAVLSGWMLIGGLLGIVGLILGIIAINQAKKAGAPKALAITGLILSILGVLSAIFVTVIVITALGSIDFGGLLEACQQYQDNNSDLQKCVNDYVETH